MLKTRIVLGVLALVCLLLVVMVLKTGSSGTHEGATSAESSYSQPDAANSGLPSPHAPNASALQSTSAQAAGTNRAASIEVLTATADTTAPILQGWQRVDSLPGNQGPDPAQPASAVKPITVLLLPLVNLASDPAFGAVDAFYAEFSARLRAIPGLTLLETDWMSIAPATRADWTIAVSGIGPVPGNMFGITVNVGIPRLDPSGAFTIVQSLGGYSGNGGIGASCSDQAYACRDPVTLAADYVREVRAKWLPGDPTEQLNLVDQMLDVSLAPRIRLNALKGLGVARREPVGIRGAIDLVSSAAEGWVRAQAWKAMRGARNPDLIEPLVESLRRDRDDEVRLQAVAVLGADFAAYARVGTALDVAARMDSSALVRALAMRALNGEGAWKNYILASLKDTGLAAEDRIEALRYSLEEPPGAAIDLQSVFNDGDALRSLAELVLQPGVSLKGNGMLAVLANLLTVDRPELADLFFANVRRLGNSAASYMNGVHLLLPRIYREPRVHAALERISGNDQDPQRRRFASELLRMAVQSPTR